MLKTWIKRKIIVPIVVGLVLCALHSVSSWDDCEHKVGSIVLTQMTFHLFKIAFSCSLTQNVVMFAFSCLAPAFAGVNRCHLPALMYGVAPLAIAQCIIGQKSMVQ